MILVLLLAMTLVITSACNGFPGIFNGSQSKPGTSGGSNGSGGFPWSSPKTQNLPPQKALVSGAKSYMSTNTNTVLTEKEDGAYLLGLTSEFLNDVNNTSNETSIKATIGNIVSNGKASEDSVNLDLDLVHNAKSGDSSVEFALGAGSDTNVSAGIYVKDGVGIIKSPDADQDVLLYTLPKYSDKTLQGTLRALFSGLLSDDGAATETADSQKEREELAAKIFDPWLTDTNSKNYKESKETLNLLGKDVACRVVTLTMNGQEAYDFALKNFQLMDSDPQFANTNSILGVGMSAATNGLQNLPGTSGGDSGDDGDSKPASDSATKEFISGLEGMSKEDIEEVNFTVSTIFAGDKAIGLRFETVSTDTSMKLFLLTYRKGLEHQFNITFEDQTGVSFAVDASKVKSTGSTYKQTMTMSMTDSNGKQVLDGKYDGTTDETATKQEKKGKLTIDLKISISEDDPQSLKITGDISNLLTKTSSGYTGDGKLVLTVDTGEDTSSLELGLSVTMKKSDSAAVTPPKYTDSNSVKVTNLESLADTLGLDYSQVKDQSKSLQVLYLLGSLLTSSVKAEDFGTGNLGF